MFQKFTFQAATPGEASTIAAQKTIVIAEGRRREDAALIRVKSIKPIDGNRYEATIYVPDLPKKGPGKSSGLIFGGIPKSPQVPQADPETPPLQTPKPRAKPANKN